jgi:hydrogenase nickel incorporation protein HypA/HybF
MHELAIMENVLDIAVDFGKKNNAKEIVQINIVLGAVSNVIPKWTRLFFEMIAKDTIAEKATLEFEILPAYVKCRKCGSVSAIKTDPPTFVCQICGSDEVHLLSGREFQIKSIEII